MVAHVRLFSGVLSDVHLKMRELKVALGAAGVEADKWLPLFLGLGVHLRLSGDHMTLLMPHLWDDKGGMS